MTTAPTIDDVLAMRTHSRADLEAQRDVTVDVDVGYGLLRGVDRLHAPSVSPGFFFFSGDELKLVYVPRAALAGASASRWLGRVGEGPQLRSRTGKRAVLEVRPGLGLAFAHEEDELQLAEVFAPTTLDGYERAIYEDPGSFVR
jgi:hypothetical protein